MYKALKTIQRSYQRAPFRAFVLSQKQHTTPANLAPVPNRSAAMQHKTKAAGNV